MPSLPGLNEETVKNRWLVPYLEDLGFSRSELRFEDKVTVRIGHTVHDLTTATGRLDILVQSSGWNLLLVEIKAEDLDLTDDDCDQAISYAMLVRPFAPVVLLSNGKRHRLFESISGREITDTAEIRKGQAVYHAALPPAFQAAYEEAVGHFLGYSAGNLLTFCRRQTAERMASLKGSAADRTKKYLPDLFVPRQALDEDVTAFLASSQPLLAIIADAGSGKTCCSCALTDALLAAGEAVLFYRGFQLTGAILQGLADDLNWTFSEERSAPQLVDRLDGILGSRRLVIVIDALDEWPHPRRVQDLLATARRLAGHRIQLIVTCKTSVWSSFLSAHGTPTGLADLCFSPRDGRPYFLLPAMSSDEFLATVERYQVFYGVTGAFEIAAWHAARQSPFLLRILFEVAERQRATHLTFSSLEFFNHYYEQALDALDADPQGADRRGADRLLCAAARVLYESGQERVHVADLARAAGGLDFDRLLQRLLHARLLESSATVAGEQISSYFSLLRDYLTAFRVHRWQDLPDDELVAAIGAVGGAGVRMEALTFFYRHAAERQRRLLDGRYFSRARDYIHAYDRILRTDFPALRNRFSPYTAGEIGFVGELDLRYQFLAGYGFRVREGDAEEVLLLPLVHTAADHRSNLLELHGTQEIHASGSFLTADVLGEVLATEIGRPLRGLVNRGGLDESACPELAAEVVATLVAANRRIFSAARHAASAGPLFPISLADVRRWLRYEILHRHFNRLRQENAVRSGRIEVTRHENGGISYGWAPDADDLAWIEQQVEAHLDDSEDAVRRRVARSLDIGLTSIDRRLLEAVSTLEAQGLDAIAGLPFQGAAELWGRLWQGRARLDELIGFLDQLLHVAFGVFRKLVAHNFPTMAADFFSVTHQPLLGIGRLDRHPEQPGSWYVTMFLCVPDESATEDRFVFRERHALDTRILRNPGSRFEVCVDGDWRLRLETSDESVGLIQRHFRLASVLHPSHDYLDRHQYAAPAAVQPVLRGLVYDLVRIELPAAFARLCRRYGAEPTDHN